MKRTARCFVGAAATAVVALVGLGAAPAQAESQAHKDPRGDVKTLQFRAAAAKPGIDIVRSENEYRGGTLSLSISVADLEKKGYGAAWLIGTDLADYQLTYDHTKKKPVVTYEVTAQPRLGLPGRAARGDSCAGIKAKAQGDEVVASVPRACFNGADRVRVASLLVEPSTSSARVDDARQKGFDPDAGPKYAPWLDRN